MTDPENSASRSTPPPKPAGPTWAEIALLALVLALHVGLAVVWIGEHGHPLMDRAPADLLQVHDLWRLGRIPRPYPPLAHAVCVVGFALGGAHSEVAARTLVFFLVPFVLGLWWLGRQVGGPSGGLTLAFAGAGAPWFAFFLRTAIVEVSTAALVVLTLAALLASRGCTRPGPTASLGLLLGLGLLSRWTFAFFLVGPALVTAWTVARAGPSSRLYVVLALAASGGTAWLLSPFRTAEPLLPLAAMAGLLYLLWGGLTAAAAARLRKAWCPGAALLASLGAALLLSMWWYILALPSMRALNQGNLPDLDFAFQINLSLSAVFLGQASWMAWPLMALGVLAAWTRPAVRPAALLAGTSLVGGVGLFAAAGVPLSARYLLPALGPALILGFGWWGLHPALRLAGPAAALALSLLQVGGAPREWAAPLEFTRHLERGLVPAIPTCPAPDRQQYPVEAVTRACLAAGERRLRIFSMASGEPIQPEIFTLEASDRGRYLGFAGWKFWGGFREKAAEGKPGSRFCLLIGRTDLDMERARKFWPFLEGYRTVREWKVVHDPGWCGQPWAGVDPDCAEADHVLRLQLLEKEKAKD